MFVSRLSEHLEMYTIGIDLGTSYSSVGVFRYGKVEIIKNEQGNTSTSSYVAFTDTEILIGDAAKNQVAMNPTNTVFDVKRLIGLKYDNPTVALDRKHWPFEVTTDGGKPKIRVAYKNVEKTFKPEEILSLIFLKMKETAEHYLGERVTNAVISVPSRFNTFQRLATKEACTIAGLNVLRIINEPLAAAIAHGLNKIKGESNVLVFDFGGGFCDVSILNIEDQIFDVIAYAGDTHLGGEDLDNRMVDHFIQEFKRKHKKDLTNNIQAILRLRTACERAKRTLSSYSQANIEIDSLFEGIDFYTSITRSRFEELCSDLFRSALKPVEKALTDSKLNKTSIDEIVLVGGSSNIPQVQGLLTEYFKGGKQNITIIPDEAVVYGTAVQAAILNGDNSEKIQDFMLLDATPYSLGIETAKEVMTILIKKNTIIPTKQSQIVSLYSKKKTCVQIKIFEGERPTTKDNNLLGMFELNGISSENLDAIKIIVTFDIDVNGILTVTAEEGSTGIHKTLIIPNDGERLSKEEINLAQVNNKLETDTNIKKEKLDARNSLESYCSNIKTTIKNNENLLNAINETTKWLEVNQYAEKEVFQIKQKELEKAVVKMCKDLLEVQLNN